MQLFLDGSDIEKIRKYCGLGLIDGVTTNPSIILKSGKNMIEVISELASEVTDSVSAEVSALDSEKMVQEGMKLSEIAKNVTVKLPITWDGLRACNTLSKKGINLKAKDLVYDPGPYVQNSEPWTEEVIAQLLQSSAGERFDGATIYIVDSDDKPIKEANIQITNSGVNIFSGKTDGLGLIQIEGVKISR